MNIVVSQSMYFPWPGMLEQVRACDVFVHYDDVQYSKGSFTNRVQVKIPGGKTVWMTVPLLGLRLGQCIDEVYIHSPSHWAAQHLALLRQSFAGAPFAADALGLAESVLEQPSRTIAELSRRSLLALANYFGFCDSRQFVDSKAMRIPGSSSERVMRIVKALGGTRYITGHGAWDYLDHHLFEDAGIRVAYMQYQCMPYRQLHGQFTPYVTSLDLIANLGKAGLDYLQSQAIYWRELKNGPA